jgi:ubiquinone/menaquinone biosynthesis C-methylase UbiE
MNQFSDTTRSATEVRRHFRAAARSFDHLYDEDGLLQRRVRPGLHARKDIALAVVDSYEGPRVLDVGCGSGRVAEEVLEHGAGAYVGVDFSEPMLDLSRERLARFDAPVDLVLGDFREVTLDGTFDVVLGLGLFDYLPDAEPFLRRMREVCSEDGTVVASFPAWHWFNGPIRKFRYERVRKVPIFNYSADDLRRMFADCGFSQVELVQPGRSGHVARARV